MARKSHLALLGLIGATTLFAASPDVPKKNDLRPLPLLAPLPLSNDTLDSQAPLPSVLVEVAQDATQHAKKKHQPLQASSRIELIRYVSGEFAKAVTPLPGARKGFRIEVGKELDDHELKQSLANTGTAVNPGDTVQITRLEFREREIVVDLNGGSGHHFRLKDHLQVGVGGGAPAATNVSAPAQNGQSTGVTLVLDYGKPLPDMSPDDLKHDLSSVLDFKNEKSAAVNWVDTLPPEYKKAIQENRALVGMDHDMVIAALGRPDHKVRERTEQGDETEDWIYGDPPSKTVFVTFLGDKVIRVKEFN
jgi:sulfur carrier protein ThiS